MDELKNVFDKIEKAELILNELENKREFEGKEDHADINLSPEERMAIDNARQTLASIKDKLTRELAEKSLELDKCQEDLALLQTRLKVGEITEETYSAKSRHLIEKIKSLEKKVLDIQNVINAKFSDNATPPVEQDNLKTPTITLPNSDAPSSPEEHITSERMESENAGKKAGEEEDDDKTLLQTTTDVTATPEQLPVEEGTGDTQSGIPEKFIPELIKTGVSNGHKRSFHLHPLKSEKAIPVGAPKDRAIKNRILWISVTGVLIGLFLIMGILLLVPRTGSNTGNLAPDFVMQLSNDKVLSLSAFKGKNVILVFWDRDFWDNQFFSVNGVIRKLYTPEKLNQLYQKSSRDELAIVAIASGTSNSEIDKLIKDYNVAFPVIVDSFGKLRSVYQINEEPTFVFIDKGGVIRARVEGPIINLSDIEQVLYAMSQNSSIKASKPPIFNVIIQSVTEKSAVINWTTSEPTTTQVDIDGKVIQTTITSSPVTLHSLTLRDLEPATPYHIRILYNINNVNVSEHSFAALSDTIVSRRYSVETSKTDTSYPEISNISTGFITDSSISVTWKTDEPATGEVDYGLNTKYSDSVSQGNNLSIWHTVKLEGLKSDTTYYLRIRSKDMSGKETVQEIEPRKTSSQIETAPKIGKRAPDFSLYSLDGTPYTINQFRGKRILLNFWLEGCPACEKEMPLIQAAFDKYNRDQLVILAVNVRGDPDKVNYFVRSQKLTFPVILDSQGNADDLYRPPYFPTTFFIDSKGIIRQIITERFESISEIDDILSQIE